MYQNMSDKEQQSMLTLKSEFVVNLTVNGCACRVRDLRKGIKGHVTKPL